MSDTKRNVYLISYDVSDAKRLRKTYIKLCGFGEPLQYSVFRCELSLLEKLDLQAGLWPILNFDHDRIMVVDLGPIGGRGDSCLEFWGTPRVPIAARGAAIV